MFAIPPEADVEPHAAARNPDDFLSTLSRIAAALERLAPPPATSTDLQAFPGYVWTGLSQQLEGVSAIDHIGLSALVGIDLQKEEVLANLRGFAMGSPANHMLLWGARGTGKSSLTKAAHAAVYAEMGQNLALVEVPRQHIDSLADLLADLSVCDRRFLLFCDDLSFDDGEPGYKSLKALLDGGIRGCPANVLLAVTSNRRHLLRRDMIENEQSTAIRTSEATEEKISLADRFGLSLGFYNVAQDAYLAMVIGHLGELADAIDPKQLAQEAENWARRRGSRSGRVASQFARHLGARMEAAAVQ